MSMTSSFEHHLFWQRRFFNNKSSIIYSILAFTDVIYLRKTVFFYSTSIFSNINMTFSSSFLFLFVHITVLNWFVYKLFFFLRVTLKSITINTHRFFRSIRYTTIILNANASRKHTLKWWGIAILVFFCNILMHLRLDLYSKDLHL